MSREELVRIDETGTIHPVGKVASQRVRARRGAFRMLPAPEHVLFMRYVGEDGARDEEDGAVVRLAGEVTSPGALCDIVSLVAQAGWRGELLVADGEAARSLFFEAGNIVGARTNVASERLRELLYRLGVLSAEQVEAVQASLPEGGRFGETAVEAGLLTREKLFEILMVQAKEVAFATLMVADGMFYFLDRYDPAKVWVRHHLSASNLLMEGVQRMDESKYFRERIPSGSHVPEPLAGRSDPEEGLRAVWHACDGRRSVLEVARAAGLPEFEATRALFQLVQSGFVHIGAPAPEGLEALVAIFNDAMAVIYEAARRADRTALLSDHLAGFALSVGIYGSLFADAGSLETGRLDEARIAANIRTLSGEDADGLLAQWLYEYVAFALFDAGSHLSRGEQEALVKAVAEPMKLLAPKA